MKLSERVMAGKHDSRFRHKEGTANRFLAEAIAVLEAENVKLEKANAIMTNALVMAGEALMKSRVD